MDDLKEYFSRKIANLRDSNNISARKLSQELLLGDNYINQIENKQSIPSIPNLKKICCYFNISLSDFFDDKTEYPIQYRELIEELNKLDTQELQKVIDFVKLITIHKK